MMYLSIKKIYMIRHDKKKIYKISRGIITGKFLFRFIVSYLNDGKELNDLC
jgi:hypothetical protein